MFTKEMRHVASAILDVCKKKSLKLTTAESCTGGLIAALFTEIPGSSAVFERGFVTYSNASKTEMLGVDAELIAECGAVSEEVAAAMAKGALKNAGVDIAVSVTGIAGPDGGTKQKPVGLVYIAVTTHDNIIIEINNFTGNREAIRLQSVEKALSMLMEGLKPSFVYVA